MPFSRALTLSEYSLSLYGCNFNLSGTLLLTVWYLLKERLCLHFIHVPTHTLALFCLFIKKNKMHNFCSKELKQILNEFQYYILIAYTSILIFDIIILLKWLYFFSLNFRWFGIKSPHSHGGYGKITQLLRF